MSNKIRCETNENENIGLCYKIITCTFCNCQAMISPNSNIKKFSNGKMYGLQINFIFKMFKFIKYRPLKTEMFYNNSIKIKLLSNYLSLITLLKIKIFRSLFMNTTGIYLTFLKHLSYCNFFSFAIHPIFPGLKNRVYTVLLVLTCSCVVK